MTKRKSTRTRENLTSANQELKKLEADFMGLERRMIYAIAGIVILIIVTAIVLFIYVQESDKCSKLGISDGRDVCYQDLAIKNNASSFCQKISSVQLRDSCLAEININSGNKDGCMQLSEAPQGYCLKKIAEKSEDENICSSIKTVFWKDSCYKSLSTIKLNYSFCQKLSSADQYDECNYDLGVNQNISAACGNIDDANLRNKCFFYYSTDTENISTCENCLMPNYQGMCYSHFAITKNNSSICKIIRSKIIRVDCLQKLNATIDEDISDIKYGGSNFTK